MIDINTRLKLRARIQSLQADRESWEQNELLASNKKLYSILAGCTDIVADYRDDEEALFAIAKKDKISSNSSTDLCSIVAKLVFGDSDRRRASVYATVLRAADKAGVQPEDLPDWIAEKGGVEAIRRSGKSRNPQPAKPPSASASSAPAANASQSFLPPGLREVIKEKRTPLHRIPPPDVDAAPVGINGFVAMVGVINDDNSIGVLDFDSDEVVVEAALRTLAVSMGLLFEESLTTPEGGGRNIREIALPSGKAVEQAIGKAAKA